LGNTALRSARRISPENNHIERASAVVHRDQLAVQLGLHAEQVMVPQPDRGDGRLRRASWRGTGNPQDRPGLTGV
jgi:hypothetical protein